MNRILPYVALAVLGYLVGRWLRNRPVGASARPLEGHALRDPAKDFTV